MTFCSDSASAASFCASSSLSRPSSSLSAASSRFSSGTCSSSSSSFTRNPSTERRAFPARPWLSPFSFPGALSSSAVHSPDAFLLLKRRIASSSSSLARITSQRHSARYCTMVRISISSKLILSPGKHISSVIVSSAINCGRSNFLLSYGIRTLVSYFLKTSV